MSYRTTVVLILFVGTSAIADDSVGVIAFARKNANLYAIEAKEVGNLSAGSSVTLSTQIDSSFFVSTDKYDPREGVYKVGSYPSYISSLLVRETCRGNGSYVGQTVYGAKVQVRKGSCERFFIRHSEPSGVAVKDVSLAMTPAQYRIAYDKGLKAEVEFEILDSNSDSKKPIVEFTGGSSGATISDPSDISMKVWTIYGDIKTVRYQLPGSKDYVELWSY